MRDTTDSQGRALAGWWPRAWALVLDDLFVGLAILLVSLLLLPLVIISGLFDSPAQIAFQVIGLILLIGLPFAYAIYLPVRSNGQTPGKRINNLRIVRIDNQPVAVKTMLIRFFLMQYIPIFLAAAFSKAAPFCLIYLLVDYLFPLWDNKRQCLHDKAAGTQVIHQPPLPPAGWFADPQDPGQLRWFDGRSWTEHTSPAVPASLPDQSPNS